VSNQSRFTDPAFIRTLEGKALGYYFGADQYKSSTKERFSKRITADPVFQAIQYLRIRAHIKQRTQEFLSDFPSEHREQILGADDPQQAKMLSDTLIGAVRQGNITRLQEIVKLCELHEAKMDEQLKERKRDPISWHYYVGIVACGFLKKGTVPTKKQVKEDALRERAIVELSKLNPPRKDKRVKTDTLETWAAGQGWQRGTYEVRAGKTRVLFGSEIKKAQVNPDLSNKEKVQKIQAVRQRLAEEGKPALVKDREKRIAAKVEELRRLQPKRWPRVFKELGLEELPSAPTHPGR